jgi:protein-S-isoprenylcysteine O-methyltransferase Ste14
MSVVSTIVPVVDWGYFSPDKPTNAIATIAGFIILWSGVFLRNISIKILGKYFTPTVQLQSDHNLVTTTPYNVIRHPSYLGALLAIVGIAIFLNSFIGAAVAFVCMMIAYVIRIEAEEKALESLFGSAYTDYKRRTKRLIPFLW